MGAFTHTTLAAAGTVAILTSLNAAALLLAPFTIVWTRGKLYMRSDQEAATERQEVAYGEIVVQEPAFAIGVTAVPIPNTESSSDFHVYEWLMNHSSLTSTELPGVTQVIDSKAMRKVDVGQDIIAVAEVAAGSSGLLLSAFSRVLIKLH